MDAKLRWKPTVVAVGLTLTSAFAGYIALKWGIADRYSFAARELRSDWRSNNNVDTSELELAIFNTRRAVDWAPNNPAYLDQLATFLLMKLELGSDPDLAPEIRSLLAKSAELRPQWPNNWARKIKLKYLTEEFDEELGHAIRNATTFGPWEPAVIEAVAEAGVAGYSRLDNKTQAMVIESLKRGFQSSNTQLPTAVLKAIQRSPRSWTLEFIEEMVDFMVASEWNGRLNNETLGRAAVMFWPVATEQQRRSLAPKVARAATMPGGGQILSALNKQQKRLVCLYLPRRQPYLTSCGT